jgi:hypothetical protein
MADGGAGRSWLRAGLTSGRVWKVLGVAGVAATGVVVARDHRRRTRMSPDEVRDRLHQRYAATREEAPGDAVGGDA